MPEEKPVAPPGRQTAWGAERALAEGAVGRRARATGVHDGAEGVRIGGETDIHPVAGAFIQHHHPVHGPQTRPML